MAVGANSYSSVTDVERLIGDLVVDRDFTSTTIPKAIDVEAWIDARAARLNSELKAAGFSVPVTTADAEAHGWLKFSNAAGAAAIALSAMPAESIAPNADEIQVRTRGQFLDSEYRAIIDVIRGDEGLGRFPATRDRSLAKGLKVGSYKDADGNVKKPYFERGGFDFMNTRSLVTTT
jgi:hypothetical protein